MHLSTALAPLMAAAFALTGCGGGDGGTQTGAEAPLSPSATPTPSSEAPGVAFTDPEAFFSAEFVTTPKRNEESVKGSAGTFPVFIYFNDVAGQGIGVTFTDFRRLGSISQNAFLDGALQGIATQNGGTVTSQSRVDFAGGTAADGVIEYADGRVQYARAVLLPPGQGYTLTQIDPAGGPRSPEYERLLATFRHLPS